MYCGYIETMAVLQRCKSVRKSEGFDQKVRLRALQCKLFRNYCDICNWGQLTSRTRLLKLKRMFWKKQSHLKMECVCRLGIYKRFEQQQSQVLLPNTATAVLCEAIHLLFYCFKCKRNPQRHCSVWFCILGKHTAKTWKLLL